MVNNMENKSIWTYNIRKDKYESLNNDIRCDVLIIGGGIAGLTTAYFLKNSNLTVTLIDKDMCGMGISARSTGKLTVMQDLIYNKIKDNYNEEIANVYYNSQKKAIKIVRDIINKNNISCNYDKTPSYVFTNDINKINNFKKEINFYYNNGIKYKVKNIIPIKYPCLYSLKTNIGGVFNPVRYLLALREIVKENINIYENTMAVKIYKRNNGYIVHTNNNHIIKAKYVVVCSHYPFFIVPGLIPFKTSVSKFYLVCGETDSNKGIQLISNDDDSTTIRYHSDKLKNYLIYGYGNHMTNNQLDVRVHYNKLLKEYKKYFNGKIKCYWLSHDIITYDNLPFIGSVSKKDKNLFIATGFNKWGNTNGTLAGKIISDIILGKDNPYIKIFCLKRKMSLSKIKNLIVYNYNAMSRYVLNKIDANMIYYDETVKVENIDGKLCGIYIDKNNNKHIVSNICPHMKCNLVFNYKDKTWDCPCHCSRFDIDGNIIFGPSVYNIKINDNN